MTQSDVSDAVNWVINTYNGQTIGYPGVEVGQCPAPVGGYMNHLGMPVPPMANDRADGWGTNFPDVLVPYMTHETFQPGKVYPEGTILIWNSPHIAVVVNSDGSNTVKVFEQNADPDGSGCHTFNREVNNAYHTCTYALIPIVAPVAPMYTLEPFDPRIMVLTSNASIWDLTTPTANVAIANYDNNYQFTAQGKALHQDGRTYYMPDVTVPHGFLDENCIDYVPMPTPPPVTTIQNFTPTTVKPATKYTLVVGVDVYDSSSDATISRYSTGTFPAGDYYVYDTGNGTHLLNITNTAQKSSCKWVLDKDNVLPAVAEPDPIPETPVITNAGEADESWKATYKPFTPSPLPVTSPVLYNIALTYTVVDLDNKKANLTITKGKTIDIYGTFVKDGITYYRPRLKADTNFEFWYGVPVFDTYVGQAILTKPVPLKKRPTSLFDKLYEVKEVFKEDEIAWMDIIPHWFKRK